MISLIVAHDKNRVIGYENKMPWHLPGELKYFKETTMGKPMIMGRKTFESIGKPLPGRRNIIVTRNNEYSVEGIEVANSIDEALELAGDVEEVMVIGGEEIFKLVLPVADRLYITHIEHEFEGDTFFPIYGDEWKLVSCSDPVDSTQGYTFKYCIYDRK
ncbi:dihydrofolate reductase [Ureibacillus massiliensis 4400831 = CIP 108448 = CCUG 49529]|uniref:Dihydrofolate reductase n=1 Tax=Ureibacillus massiliensis 4400831 = CIP 108448 = CCUG 49529 TaxID=1211035 RepID=A0A0A3J1E2_9BACL|nr:type 3 dihydrofolate reductase [Ureibacillus massiliensis]KGR89550.1 dihydrofolate reductase [Ureibacillus massiliensis 4400831 = CIP 108448 = CCUG 49529]